MPPANGSRLRTSRERSSARAPAAVTSSRARAVGTNRETMGRSLSLRGDGDSPPVKVGVSFDPGGRRPLFSVAPPLRCCPGTPLVTRGDPAMPRRLLFATLLLALPAAGRAEAPKRDHDITVEDYFSLATIFDCVISPDGQRVAYTEGRWQQSSDDRKTDLWVVETKGGPARRLTGDRADDRSPQWAPD